MLSWFQFNEVSPAAASTVASSHAVMNSASYASIGVAAPLDDGDALDVVAGLIGATGGSLSLWLQTSLDEVNWFDSIAFPQLTAGASAVIYRASVAHYAQSATPTVVGKNLSPALAANTSVQGGWGSRARLVMTAGSGTTAGAVVRVTIAVQRTNKAEH